MEDDDKARQEVEKKRKEAMKDAGLSTDELREAIGASKDTPYIVNISDDPSMAGVLIFYLKDGPTQVGKNVGKGQIKLNGLGVQDNHALFTNTGNNEVKIKPTGTSRVLVNGQFITGEVSIKNNSRIVFGHGNSFKIMIPLKASEGVEEKTTLNEYELIMKDRLNADTPLTNNIKKYLDELLHRIGAEKLKKFVLAFEKGLDDLDEANEYTAQRFKLKPTKEHDVYFSIEVMVDVMDYDEDEPEFAFRCRDKQTNEVLFLWSHEKFLDRLEMMRDWYSDIMDDGVSNRERFIDPWVDVTT